MPCRSDPDSIIEDKNAEINRLTRLLCTASRWIFHLSKPDTTPGLWEARLITFAKTWELNIPA